MARSFSTSSQFDVSARVLFELYGDTTFQEDKAVHMGALSATATRREREDGRVEMTIEMLRPKHGGGGEERATMTMVLDPRTFGSTWKQVVHGYEERARVEGTSTVRAEGEQRCSLTIDGTIEIRIPLLGRMIERKIVDAIERDVGKEEGFIRRTLQQRSG